MNWALAASYTTRGDPKLPAMSHPVFCDVITDAYCVVALKDVPGHQRPGPFQRVAIQHYLQYVSQQYSRHRSWFVYTMGSFHLPAQTQVSLQSVFVQLLQQICNLYGSY